MRVSVQSPGESGQRCRLGPPRACPAGLRLWIDLAARRVLLSGARSSQFPALGSPFPSIWERRRTGLMWAVGGHRGGRLRRFTGQKRMGMGSQKAPEPHY